MSGKKQLTQLNLFLYQYPRQEEKSVLTIKLVVIEHKTKQDLQNIQQQGFPRGHPP
jgi:hypothetical protein